ncbi:alpha/beta hydrolase [Erythrobacter colymbi]|uniref:alpha/beta hydrolase n=1 Tax=Erythrobacter colymbi TaxID=1161202 RepID=UPI000A3BB549|nr:alpha/beta hydrolase [Erythrobacter colymbi]
MKHLAAAAAALAATLAGCAPATPAPDARFAVTDTTDYDPRTVNTLPAPPPTLKVAYGTESARQYGELRMPQGKGPFPLAVIWHGGCWAGMGGTVNVAPLAAFLAANGVATWTPSYRELGSDGGWPNTFTDWAQGLAYVKTLARDHPLDLSRITLMGHSAGVTPAVWLASGNKGDAVVAADLPRARALVALDGPLAVGPFVGADAAICGQPVIAPLLGGSPTELPGRYAMLDPVSNAPLVKRLLVVDGALPDPDPAVLDRLRAQGIAVEVIRVDQAQHFNLLVPGTKDFAAIGPALLDIAKGR